MAEHTPTPWILSDTKAMDIRGNIIRVVDKDKFPMAFVPAWNEPGPGEVDGSKEAAANAAFIVKAVNNHEALVALAKAYEQWEADIILENKCWTGQNVRLTDELYERMIQLQTQRNLVLSGVGGTGQ